MHFKGQGIIILYIIITNKKKNIIIITIIINSNNNNPLTPLRKKFKMEKPPRLCMSPSTASPEPLHHRAARYFNFRIHEQIICGGIEHE